jgi:hypothetical protein
VLLHFWHRQVNGEVIAGESAVIDQQEQESPVQLTPSGDLLHGDLLQLHLYIGK